MSAPAAKPRVFLSHAGEDKIARVEIFNELKRQGIDFFDYSKPYGPEDIGTSIETMMRRELKMADFIIVIVSANSTRPDKKVVMAEVHDALRMGLLRQSRIAAVQIRGIQRIPLGDKGQEEEKDFTPPNWVKLCAANLRNQRARMRHSRLFFSHAPLETDLPVEVQSQPVKGDPVRAYYYGGHYYLDEKTWNDVFASEEALLRAVIKTTSGSWFGPFSELKAAGLWSHADQVVPGCFSGLVRYVCNRLGLTYRPPAPPDSRLPLYDELYKEIWTMPEYLRQMVLSQLDLFQGGVVVGGWQEAQFNIRAIRNLLKKEGRRAYFPTVIEGLCHLRMEQPEEAAFLFREAIELSEKDRSLERMQRREPEAGKPQKRPDTEGYNAHGGLAKALFLQGRLARESGVKLQRYTEALQAAITAVEKCLVVKDDILAPRARWDTLRMALEIREDLGEQSGHSLPPALRDAIELAETDDGVFDLDTSDFGLEDRIKKEIVKAQWLRNQGRWEEVLATIQALLDQPQGTVRLTKSCFEHFPAANNLLLAAFADEALFFDEPGTAASPQGLKLEGTQDNFSIREKERRFHFRRARGDEYEVSFRDIVTALLRYEAMCGIGARPHAEMALEKAALELGAPEFYHRVIQAWCDANLPEEALRFSQRVLTEASHWPGVLLDAARLHLAFDHRAQGLDLARRCADACEYFLNTGSGPHSASDLAYWWGHAQILLGYPTRGEAAYELSGGPATHEPYPQD